MADPVTPNGAVALTLDPGKTLVVSTGANASGQVTVFSGNSQVDVTEPITSNANKTYGPYDAAKTVRILAQGGTINYSVKSAVSALPQLAAATISADGKTISGVGTKPLSPILVYLSDTGIPLGQTTSLADGSWSLTGLKLPLHTGDRVGYDPVVVGPVTTVGDILLAPGQVLGLTTGDTTATTQALTWQAPTDAGTPVDYLVEYRAVGTTNFSSVVSSDTSETLTGLTAGTSYQYKVTARNATGSGPASVVVSKSTSTAPASGGGALDFSDPANSGHIPGV
jgi:hypothetical protein